MRHRLGGMNKYIVADPGICHGKPTFRGTRIMVWQVLEMLEAGEGIDHILAAYPSLTRSHVKAALHLAVERLAGEQFVPLA